MVWEEYRQDAELHSDEYHSDSDTDSPPCDHPIAYHEWCEWYSNDLYNMWSGLKTYKQDCGLDYYIAGDLQYDDFCVFMYKFSNKLKSKHPS
jgi:hypothetical protein